MKYNLTVNPQKSYWPKKRVSQNGQTPNIIGICSYCVLDRPVFELNQILLHPELTLWWSSLLPLLMVPTARNLAAPPTPCVYSTVYSGVDQRKHQSSASLAFVWGIHRGSVNSPHKWPVTRKMFPFDDVIMDFFHAMLCCFHSCLLNSLWPSEADKLHII